MKKKVRMAVLIAGFVLIMASIVVGCSNEETVLEQAENITFEKETAEETETEITESLMETVDANVEESCEMRDIS